MTSNNYDAFMALFHYIWYETVQASWGPRVFVPLHPDEFDDWGMTVEEAADFNREEAEIDRVAEHQVHVDRVAAYRYLFEKAKMPLMSSEEIASCASPALAWQRQSAFNVLRQIFPERSDA